MNGDLEFTVLSVEGDLPFRNRALFAHFLAFEGSPDGGDCVLVEPSLRPVLAGAARQSLPRETGGLLVGRVFSDSGGPYTVVLDALDAPPGAGGPGTFTMGPELVSQMREQANQRHPHADVIGWWHSHRAPSCFSATDVRTQRLWAHPQHVGLLVFACGGPWAVAYQGPGSLLLRPTASQAGPPSPAAAEPGPLQRRPWEASTAMGAREERSTMAQLPGHQEGLGRIDEATPLAVTVGAGTDPGSRAGFHPDERPRPHPRLPFAGLADRRDPRFASPGEGWRLPLTVLIVVITLAAASFLLLVTTTSDPVTGLHGPPPRLACEFEENTVSPEVRCEVAARGGGTIEWYVDGAHVATGPSFTLPRDATGQAPVTARLIDGNGDEVTTWDVTGFVRTRLLPLGTTAPTPSLVGVQGDGGTTP